MENQPNLNIVSTENSPAVLEITSTPEFKKWFDGSVVTDADNKPKIVYHGSKSPERFTEFKTEHDDADLITPSSRLKIKSSISKGVYFTENKDYIKELRGEGVQTYEVFLSMKNPYAIDESITSDKLSVSFVEGSQAQGYDGIITSEGDGTYIVFESDQILIIPE